MARQIVAMACRDGEKSEHDHGAQAFRPQPQAMAIRTTTQKYEAQLDLRHGAHLAELRYGNNKRSHDLSATEQRVLEDFEYGKLDKQHDNLRVVKPNHWR